MLSAGALVDVAGSLSLDATAEILDEYLRDLAHRASPFHVKNVRARLTRLFQATEVGDSHAIHPLEVIRYRNRLVEQGAANRTANLVVQSLSAMMKWAVACGLAEENPVAGIPRLPVGSSPNWSNRSSA